MTYYKQFKKDYMSIVSVVLDYAHRHNLTYVDYKLHYILFLYLLVYINA